MNPSLEASGGSGPVCLCTIATGSAAGPCPTHPAPMSDEEVEHTMRAAFAGTPLGDAFARADAAALRRYVARSVAAIQRGWMR